MPGSLLHAIGEPAWLVDAATLSVVAVNAEAQRLLGRSADKLVGMPAAALLPTPEDEAHWATLRESLAAHGDAGGRACQVLRRVRPVRGGGADGAIDGFLVVVQDRSDEQRRIDERERLLAELQATLESTHDGILVTDLGGRIRAFNRRFAAIWEIPEALLTERNDASIRRWLRSHCTEPRRHARRFFELLRSGERQATERLRLTSGQVVEVSTRPQMRHGRPLGRVWAFRDRTELVAADARIEALASTDALTGLPNRSRLVASVADALRRGDRPLALMLLDVDHFRQVNDGLGPLLGDEVLRRIAQRLSGCLRAGDVVARIGGDQFALLIHDADATGAEAVARRALDAVALPMAVDGMQFTTTASVGIALHPTHAVDPDMLMRHAESAMNLAKRGGRGCFRLHRPSSGVNLRERMRLDHALRQALAGERDGADGQPALRLHYQPQVAIDRHDDVRAGARVVGAEALLRWRDPELGEVSPGRFIPVAEESGLIVPVGEWVLAQAIAQAAAWRRAGLAMPVSVNVSALQFQQASFVERVAAALRRHRLPPSALELELTESLLLHDADDALARLIELGRIGVRLAVDDFGTGYSSLAYLRRFPIDRLKIDRSFVADVPDDAGGAAIVRAIVQMAHAMKLDVVAEGVETEAQRAFLRDCGCNAFQGFLHAPALDPATFVERLRQAPAAGLRRPRLSLVAGG